MDMVSPMSYFKTSQIVCGCRCLSVLVATFNGTGMCIYSCTTQAYALTLQSECNVISSQSFIIYIYIYGCDGVVPSHCVDFSLLFFYVSTSKLYIKISSTFGKKIILCNNRINQFLSCSDTILFLVLYQNFVTLFLWPFFFPLKHVGDFYVFGNLTESQTTIFTNNSTHFLKVIARRPST